MNYLKVKKLKIDEINVESLFFIHLSTNFYKYLLKNTLLGIDFTKKFAKIRISGNSYLSTTKLNSNLIWDHGHKGLFEFQEEEVFIETENVQAAYR